MTKIESKRIQRSTPFFLVAFFFLLTIHLSSISISLAQFKVIGYLPSWGNYPNSINSVDLTKVTHINIAFANPNASGDLSTSNGSLANLATVVTAAHAQNVKVLMSIGGAGAPGTTYSNLINTDLSGFVAKIVQYAVDNNLDGIDVDIEGDVLNGSTMNSTQYQNFITSLTTGLHAQNKLITAALATWFASRVTNTAAASFDFINIMSYDEYGTWTGPGQHSSYSFAVNDLDYWRTTKGIAASKLTVGVPFYGYYWGAGNSSYTFNDILTYYPGTQNQDKITPSSGGIIYYNGIPTIKQKTAMALQNAGGIMIWQLMGDASGQYSLLNAIDEVIQGYATNSAPTVSIITPAASASYTEGDTIPITLNAADTDGSIMKVEYFAGTYKIGDSYQSPFSMDWTGAGIGTYSITVIATDNNGVSTTSSPVSITVAGAGASLPFTGTAVDIPGKVEAENFNLGGNNIGYYDATSTNLGGSYRTTRVDIEECLDNGGTYDIGWTDANEWMEYSINVTAAGNYDFQCRVAANNSSGTFHIEIDGINVSGTVTVTSSGGWQTWKTVTIPNVALTQGAKKMRVVMNAGGFNLNYVNIATTTTTGILDQYQTKSSTVVYPNPMNQSTVVRFQSELSGSATVSLFDELGREVAVYKYPSIVAGMNEITIQRENLQKGIYFCRIVMETTMQTTQIVIE